MTDVSVWIGGKAYYKSSYKWSDGTAWQFVNWAEKEPNNKFGKNYFYLQI